VTRKPWERGPTPRAHCCTPPGYFRSKDGCTWCESSFSSACYSEVRRASRRGRAPAAQPPPPPHLAGQRPSCSSASARPAMRWRPLPCASDLPACKHDLECNPPRGLVPVLFTHVTHNRTRPSTCRPSSSTASRSLLPFQRRLLLHRPSLPRRARAATRRPTAGT
jgi:hypothetical protein